MVDGLRSSTVGALVTLAAIVTLILAGVCGIAVMLYRKISSSASGPDVLG